MKKSIAALLLLFSSVAVLAQQFNPLLVQNDRENQRVWVDSIYSNMSLQEKVGQLFMVDIYSSDPKEKKDKVKGLIQNQYIGGIIFSKGGPKQQVQLNNEFQALSRTPLIMAMDAEWGLAMRLDSTFAYPWNMTLGAISDNKIIQKIGKRIGEHTKRIGMHINFAPVVDININPANPIIGNRSFGEDKYNVTEKSVAFMKGMQEAGIISNAKHFPGHGDTDADSHLSLPTINFTRERIDSIELFPYRRLIKEGLGSVMVAHLNIPALDARPNFPSSLSNKVVTDLLQGELGFNGLIFTDALSMKGVANYNEPGAIDLAAFIAGNDVLLISEDIPKAHGAIIKAYNEGIITEERLMRSVKKILFAKYKVGLHNYLPVDATNIVADLNDVVDDVLYEEAIQSALTVLKNDDEILPIKDLKNTKIGYVNFGDDSGEYFLNQLNKYSKVDWVKADNLNTYIQKLKEYDVVIIGFHKQNDNPWKSFKFSKKELVWIYEIARKNKVILDVFARPYSLLDVKTTANFEAIVMSYQNSRVSQELSAQLIFGARASAGKLPVSLGEGFPVGSGLQTSQIGRLQYGTPESVGVNSKTLTKIDSLVQVGFDEDMMPGAQILVARKGKVIYQKNFGYHTQDKKIAVKDNDIYDVASLTKILSTMPLVMDLYDRKLVTMETTLSQLLPEYEDSNKADINMKDMLMHYAKLTSWIPFYKETMDSVTKLPSPRYYSKKSKGKYTIKISDNLFLRKDFKDSIFEQVRTSELRERLSYKYSDLPYYILKKYLETYYGMGLENLVQDNVYQSLGAVHTTYLPLEKFPRSQIAPTEQDTYFRMQKVHGYVHDQGAAMLGGVGGHAGLFSNSNDVAKIMQMYLWDGSYGGKRYFGPETMQAFNSCYYCEDDVRRGVGFDKPQLDDDGPTCGCVSMTSFGHSGFTGTFTWADPSEEIVYVFLSNRTYPSADNKKIIQSNLRSNIQEVIYEAIENKN
ncbi:MAG: glycoside hydrolase family 3 N-terminal domain-containing protein [Flavobacteriales bacterium]